MRRKSRLNPIRGLASLRFGIEKYFAIFIFLLFFTLGAAAQESPNQPEKSRQIPDDFVSDGCSMFPDFDYGDCCVAHDKIYYFGGSYSERRRADNKLFKCVAAKKGVHHKFIAPVMWVGVRVFGAEWLNKSFSWGFGKKREKIRVRKSSCRRKRTKCTS